MMPPRIPVAIPELARALGAPRQAGDQALLPADAPRWFGPRAPVRRWPGPTGDGDASLWIAAPGTTPPVSAPWLELELADEVVEWRLQRALDRHTHGAGVPGTLTQVGRDGVLITGASGVGKSHLALALLERGHALIADDLVMLQASGNEVEGYAPPAAAPCQRLAVRGLGPIRVRQHFGNRAVARQTLVRLIVHLDPGTDSDPLNGGWQAGGLLGRPIARLALRPGAGLALVIEAALRELALASACAVRPEHGTAGSSGGGSCG